MLTSRSFHLVPAGTRLYKVVKVPGHLTDVTRKGVQFQWGQKEQFAFEMLRAKLVSEPVLRQPQLDQQFEIEVDALGFAIGVVLMQ